MEIYWLITNYWPVAWVEWFASMMEASSGGWIFWSPINISMSSAAKVGIGNSSSGRICWMILDEVASVVPAIKVWLARCLRRVLAVAFCIPFLTLLLFV
jgi:hypothetical protein